MIYKFLMSLLPYSPIFAILGAIGFYIVVKRHGVEPKPAAGGDYKEDDMVFGNPHAMNNDNFDMVNGPNAIPFR